MSHFDMRKTLTQIVRTKRLCQNSLNNKEIPFDIKNVLRMSLLTTSLFLKFEGIEGLVQILNKLVNSVESSMVEQNSDDFD